MKRPREHELETLSNSFILRFFSDWICDKCYPDYGLDYKITIVEKNQVTTNFFFIQNKATDSIKIKGDYINFDLDVDHLKYFLQLPRPVLLILYDGQDECAYWINLHKYHREVLDNEDSEWIKKETKRLRIPINNKLNNKDIIKHEIETSSKEILRDITDNMSWSEGYEYILTDPEKLEKILNKKEDDSTETRLYLSGLYFQRDDQKK